MAENSRKSPIGFVRVFLGILAVFLVLGFPVKIFEAREGTDFFEMLQFGSVYGYGSSVGSSLRKSAARALNPAASIGENLGGDEAENDGAGARQEKFFDVYGNFKDDCPRGDFSPSSYDGRCGSAPAVVQRLVDARGAPVELTPDEELAVVKNTVEQLQKKSEKKSENIEIPSEKVFEIVARTQRIEKIMEENNCFGSSLTAGSSCNLKISVGGGGRETLTKMDALTITVNTARLAAGVAPIGVDEIHQEIAQEKIVEFAEELGILEKIGVDGEVEEKIDELSTTATREEIAAILEAVRPGAEFVGEVSPESVAAVLEKSFGIDRIVAVADPQKNNGKFLRALERRLTRARSADEQREKLDAVRTMVRRISGKTLERFKLDKVLIWELVEEMR